MPSSLSTSTDPTSIPSPSSSSQLVDSSAAARSSPATLQTWKCLTLPRLVLARLRLAIAVVRSNLHLQPNRAVTELAEPVTHVGRTKCIDNFSPIGVSMSELHQGFSPMYLRKPGRQKGETTIEAARGIVNQSRIQSSRTAVEQDTTQKASPARNNRPSDLSDPDDVFSAIRLLNELQIGGEQPMSIMVMNTISSSKPRTSSFFIILITTLTLTLSSLFTIIPPSNTNNNPTADQQDPKPSYTRAITQMWVEKFVPLHHLPNFPLPPPQLASTLITLFFEKVNPYENILHRQEFMRLYESTNLINQDRSFQALCFSLFAAGSTFSNDPRVMLPNPEDGTPNRQTAGARFLYSSLSLLCPAHLPTCTLYDLQTMAVLCHVTSIICSPLSVWSWLGLNLRRVQNAYAHRNSAPQWKTCAMTDQLRKRAVWYLAVQELAFSLILGRTSCIKSDTIDLDLPLPLTDEALSRFCSNQPPNKPNKPNQSQETSLQLTSIRSIDRAPIDSPMIFHRKFGVALQKLFAVRIDPSSRIGQRDKDAILALAHSIDTCFTETSLHNPWFPTIIDLVDLVSAGKRACVHLVYKILLHRLLIFEEPSELQLCFQSSNELIDILDHLRTRGVFEHIASWAPYTTVPATSMQLYIACNACDGISAADRANAWVGVHRCISVLTSLAPMSSLAGQLQKRLEQVLEACVTNELFPSTEEDQGTHQQSSKNKREATEVLETFNDDQEDVSGVRGSRKSQGGKRTSIRTSPTRNNTFDYPQGLPPSFPIVNNTNTGFDDSSGSQACFRNPWSQFDASLFHHLGKPTSTNAAIPQNLNPVDPNVIPSNWLPPRSSLNPTHNPPPPKFMYQDFDLNHSFID
ncbi:hypothetical protein PSHT_05940 [Puccinia striiformis]|uniref:Xylanolytic transcriptional activator regulatory domain-containing protein n=1 Tax=Puccinia striiformis TaxID=27350 RepID=A0A2S4W966_9BASI|nr:hypothetical protein PSHT_05940 [Puccinia striiformis]